MVECTGRRETEVFGRYSGLMVDLKKKVFCEPEPKVQGSICPILKFVAQFASTLKVQWPTVPLDLASGVLLVLFGLTLI